MFFPWPLTRPWLAHAIYLAARVRRGAVSQHFSHNLAALHAGEACRSMRSPSALSQAPNLCMKRAEQATTSCVIHAPTGLGRYTKILPALRKEETMTHQLVSIGWMLLALVLSASLGLERQIRGKSAGIRTQAIVGLTACLMMLISKYGFSDILIDGITRYDPSRVASQIVSGIGFLGAGIILTRHGAIRGLTTAATIWETAAIGMACGAGLWCGSPLRALPCTSSSLRC